jgi:hypothetical protein
MGVITREEAVARLTARYEEQCLLTPLLRDDVPLKTYIAANVERVQANGMLAKYAEYPPLTERKSLEHPAIEPGLLRELNLLIVRWREGERDSPYGMDENGAPIPFRDGNQCAAGLAGVIRRYTSERSAK